MSELVVRNPWDQSVVATLAYADTSELTRAIDRAARAFETTREQPPHERAELLLRIARSIEQHRDELAAMIVAEAGKPITLAEAEVARAVIVFVDAADAARRSTGQSLDAAAFAPGAGHLAIAHRFPLGIVYGLTPFNFPLNLVAHKVAPAIACGASILIKPSPRTPLCAIKLAKLIEDAGAPANQVQVIILPNALAADALRDERVKVVSFTGSAEIGWKLREQAGRRRVTLELGGNAAAIVHDDADIDAAVPMLATGAFAYAGQSCISVQRILAHRAIHDRLREALVAHTQEKILVGDPSRRDVRVGPMISPDAQARVLAMIESARAQGATVLTGGGADGPCVTPTLLENVPVDHPLCTEEAFAPLAVLAPYDSFDEALALANRSRYGLQTGVFTRDIGRILHAFHALEVGSVLINQVPTYRIDNLLYGGAKDSGAGREGVRWAIEEMTELRTLVIKRD